MDVTLKCTVPLAAAALLAACGGSSSSSSDNTPPAESKFTQTATWWFEQDLTKEKTECFDFDTDSIVSCDGSTWDVKMVHGSSGSATPDFYTNSGESGNGNGAAMGGPFDYDWEKLKGFTDGNIDDHGNEVPEMAFMIDGIDNAFTDALFEYDHVTHRMEPTYNVFVVTTDKEQELTDIDELGQAFAVQATSYFGGATGNESGNITLRYVDVAGDLTDSNAVQSLEIDATSETDWAYYEFSINGLTQSNENNWHLAFQRYTVKTNSGISGEGTVGAFAATAPEDNTEAARLAALTHQEKNWGWGTRSAWGEDGVHSSLNPSYQGTYPNALDFGFYKYYPTDAAAAPVGLSQHMLGANTENGVMLRSGEGNTYARMQVASIAYAEVGEGEKPYNGQRTYTIIFDVTE